MDTNNLYRQNIMAIIVNNKSKIFIGKYNSEFPTWTFPKWGVKKWESLLDALFREIFEETWIKQNYLKILYKYEKSFIKRFTNEEIEWKIVNKWEYYIGKQETPFILSFSWTHENINIWDNWEFSEFKWISIDALDDYIKKDLTKFLGIDFIKSIILNDWNK